MTTHSIGYDAATWFESTIYNDSNPISVATPFYTTDSGWTLTGVRVYFSARLISAAAGSAFNVFVMADDTSSGVINGGALYETVSISIPGSPGWVDATLSSPISMTANTRYWCGQHNNNGWYLAYNFSNTGSEVQATDGSNLFMGRPAAQTGWDVSEYQYTTGNHISAPSTSNFWWGVDVIAGPASSPITVSPSSIASAESFGSPTVTTSLAVSPDPIPTAESVPAPTISTSLSVAPASIPSAEAFGSPDVSTALVVSPTSIPSAESVPGPTVSTALSVAPVSIPSRESVSAPTVTSALTVAPVSIPSAESFGLPTLVQNKVVSPDSIPSGESFGVVTAGGDILVGTVYAFVLELVVLKNDPKVRSRGVLFELVQKSLVIP